MAVTIIKGKIGVADVNFYTAASPTFSRVTSSGGATTLTALAATHLPTIQSAASGYWTQNTVQRALNETISRYFGKNHSTATHTAGAAVGEHVSVFGFKNATAGTSIQAVASNMWLSTGQAKIFLPVGTYTVATPITLPRNTILRGVGEGTIVRGSATIRPSSIFKIDGSVVGATLSNLTANATMMTNTANVADGTKFSAGQYVKVSDSLNSEIVGIRSISGNVLTFHSYLRRTYRSAATTANAALCYPAKLDINDLKIRTASTVQGIGIKATVMLDSYIGPGVVIENAVDSGVSLDNQCQSNLVEPRIVNPARHSAYGVLINNANCYDNQIGGTQDGIIYNGGAGGMGNFVFGLNRVNPINTTVTTQRGIADPIKTWYRNNKPELTYAAYGATYVVACAATTDAPSEVYINGRVFKNSGTVLCDLSRTKAHTAATVGGFDRGPATATRAIYMYGVPTYNASATRQWDLIASLSGPDSGPTASATFPAWTFLGAVLSGTSATVRLLKFSQAGDVFRNERYNFLSDASLTAAQATFKSLTSAMIPIGAKSLYIRIRLQQPSAAQLSAGYSVTLASDDATNINHQDLKITLPGTTATTNRIFQDSNGEVAVKRSTSDGSRRFKYANSYPGGGATLDTNLDFFGYSLNRAGYR